MSDVAEKTVFTFSIKGVQITCAASEKLIAYPAMSTAFHEYLSEIKIVSPEECVADNWSNDEDERWGRRMNNLYGSPEGLLEFTANNMSEIHDCMLTIKKA